MTPGLYDENDNLLYDWENLRDIIDIEKDYRSDGYVTHTCHIYNALKYASKRYLGRKFKLVIGDDIEKIGKYAFRGCQNLILIEIPDSVIEINSCAFSECVDLEEIRMSESINHIGRSMFHKCQKLKKIKFKNHIYSYDDLFEYVRFC